MNIASRLYILDGAMPPRAMGIPWCEGMCCFLEAVGGRVALCIVDNYSFLQKEITDRDYRD